MKDNTPEKEGKDCGVGRLDNSHPPRDEAQWDDQRNWNHQMKIQKPMDGLDTTTWDAVMAHGLSIDNFQKSPNAKASLKDE